MWLKRCAAIEADPEAQQLWTDYPSYPDCKDKDVKAFCTKVLGQLAQYRGKKGMFGHDSVLESAQSMPAYMWLATPYGIIYTK